MELTERQKLEALSLRFYQGLEWKPEAGHFYTTSRADLEVYKIVNIEDGKVFTMFTDGKSDAISEWDEAGFLTDGFGPRRVWVPLFVITPTTQDTTQ
ncbi:hypothetical protein [Thioclava kandeliae]|uniref:Uncharacterized protein n=1 Tax=Thioclava kandeliae TaxID=3070818 RepID=A0ABV1SFE8_9RHOB